MQCLAALLYALLFIRFNKFATADVFDECDGVEDGSFVASLESCQAYVYCDGEDSILGECDDGEYFDGDSCDAAENVFCPLDEPDPEPEPEPEPETPAPTTTTTAAPTTTTAGSATTNGGDGSTMEPVTIPPVVRDSCPAAEDTTQIVLLANKESCADYYLCYHGQPIEMHCTNHLHFNMHTGKCDFPENVQCMIDRPHANKCLPHITDFFPHPDKCNYFYYCIRGFLTIQQCPFYYGWDIERRSCVQMSQAKCYNNAKRI